MSRLRIMVFAAALTAAVAGGGVEVARAETPPPPHHVDAAVDESFNEYVPGAAWLEGRILAPCCWDTSRQTIDEHRSPIANELRSEIRHRLKAGETPQAIEDDLVRRYTTKILAVPPSSPMSHMGVVLSFGLLGAGGLAAAMIARWRRRGKDAPILKPEAAGGPGDDWDQRLDAELEDKD